MAKGGSRRKQANQRFQRNVLDLAERLLPELRDLWGGGDEDRATASVEVGRLARSAEAVGLNTLAQVAASLDGWSGDSATAVSRLSAAMRGQRGRPRFAPIHVVGSGRMVTLLRRQATWVAEPLEFSADLDDMRGSVATIAPAAVVVPHRNLGQLPGLASVGAPLFVYGPENDWALQAEAVAAGATGFLRAGFELDELLLRTRRRVDAAEVGALHVFLLGEEGSERARMARALEKVGVSVVSSNVPTAVVPALDQVVPHAVVVCRTVKGLDLRALVALARAHARGNLPIIVLGADDVHGADEVVPEGLAPDQAAARVVLRCRLHATRDTAFDRVTGLPKRAVALARLDDLVAHSHRRLEPMSVGLVAIPGLAAIERRWQRSGLVQVRAAVGRTVQQSLRRTDLVGCVGPDAFIVALRGVYADVARRRMEDVLRRFARNARGQHLLRDVQLAFGVADTEARVDRLVLRAQADLDTSRSKAA